MNMILQISWAAVMMLVVMSVTAVPAKGDHWAGNWYVRRVTVDYGGNSLPRVSGSMVVYSHDLVTGRNVWLYDAATNTAGQLTSYSGGSSAYNPDISVDADGLHIAWNSSDGITLYHATSGTGFWNGTSWQPPLHERNNGSPRISGSNAAWASSHPGDPTRTDIYFYNGTTTVTCYGPTAYTLEYLDISGQKVAFQLGGEYGNVWLYDGATASQVQLGSPGNAFAPDIDVPYVAWYEKRSVGGWTKTYVFRYDGVGTSQISPADDEWITHDQPQISGARVLSHVWKPGVNGFQLYDGVGTSVLLTCGNTQAGAIGGNTCVLGADAPEYPSYTYIAYDLATGQYQTLTNDTHQRGAVRVSEDGKTIAWSEEWYEAGMRYGIFVAHYAKGDMNCDTLLNTDDISHFVQALLNPSEYLSSHPGCDILRGDMNEDGAVNGLDIQPFVSTVLPP